MTPADPRHILQSYLTALLGWHGVGAPIGGPPGRTPACRQLHGSMLFADLSGFTQLSARLTASGDAGPERISQVLNQHLGCVVQAVHACGGDVVKFAGDAVLACWPALDASERGRALTAVAAARCGREIIARQRQLPPLAEGLDLAVKVGVEQGPLELLHLGPAEVRRVLLVTGECVDGATEACAGAAPGTLHLGPGAARALTGHVHTDPRSGAVQGLSARLRALPLPLAPQISWDPTFSCYLPSTVLHRVRGRQGRWMSELRTITAMFVRLPALRTGESPSRMDQVFRAAWRPIHRHGGIINKLNIDEKGATLLAVFGLPPEVREDAATRACLAGLDLSEALSTVKAEAQVGVATGRAFCGEIGAMERREYTVIGDAVNTAARLMQTLVKGRIDSPGPPVLLDAHTARRAAADLEVDALGAVQVKGKSRPVAVHRPRRAVRSSPARRVRLVGRRPTAHRIQGAQELMLRSGQAAVVLVAGAAGLGKSALLQALEDPLSQAGAHVIRARADAYSTREDGAPLRPLVEAMLAEHEEPGPAVRRLAAEDSEVISSLWHLFAGSLPEEERPPPPRRSPPRGMRRRQVEFLLRLLAWGADRLPSTLLIDDAHHVDMLTLELVQALHGRPAAILVVLASRPPPDAAEHIWQHLRTIPEQLPLSLLSPEHQRQVAADHLGVPVEAVPPPLLALLHGRAQGNPLFLGAIIDDLLQRDVLRVGGGHCALDTAALNSAVGGLPVTLESMLLSRIDRLSTEAQFTAKVAAVLGPSFAVDQLVAVHPLAQSARSVRTDLEEMARMGVAEIEPGTASRLWRFRHVLVRDAIYDVLPSAQRRELHSRAARIAAASGASPEQPLRAGDWDAVAHHWIAAAEPGPALQALLRAASQLVRTHRHRAALARIQELDQLVSAHDISLSGAEAQARLEVLGAALLATADVVGARTHLRALLALLEEAPLASTWVARLLARLRLVRTAPPRLEESPAATRLRAARIQAHSRLAWLEHRHGDDQVALQHGIRAISLAGNSPAAAGPRALVDRLLHLDGGQLPSAPPSGMPTPWAVRVTQAATRLARASDQTSLSVAMDHLRTLVADPASRTPSLPRDQLLVLVATVHLLRGEPYQVLDELHVAGHRARAAAADELEATPATVEAVRTVALAACGSSWALGDLALLQSHTTQDHGPTSQALLHAALARAAVHQSRPDEIQAHVEGALEACARSSAVPELLLPAHILSQVTLEWVKHGGAPARAAVARVGRLLGRLGRRCPLAVPVRHAHAAAAAATRGRTLLALWLRSRATAAALHFGLPPEQAPLARMEPPTRTAPAGPLRAV